MMQYARIVPVFRAMADLERRIRSEARLAPVKLDDDNEAEATLAEAGEF